MQGSFKVSASKILKILQEVYLPMLRKLLKWFFLTMRIDGEKHALMAKAMANLAGKPFVKNGTRGPTQCKIGEYG